MPLPSGRSGSTSATDAGCREKLARASAIDPAEHSDSGS